MNLKRSRLIPIVAIVLGLIGGAFGTAACDGPHTVHTYGVWEKKEATCEEAGYRVRTCIVCGEQETEEFPALGHEYDLGKVTTQATCEGTGVRTRTCVRCQKTKEETTQPLGHDWDATVVMTAPTCEGEGRGKFLCLRCEKEEEHSIPALGHSWESVGIGTEPTCEAAGTRNVRCAVCGTSKTEELPALGHSWEDGEVITPATCEAAGERWHTCKVCETREKTAVPPLGHNWEGDYTVDQEATFDAAGSKSYHCTRCDARNGVTEIPQLQAGVPILYEFRLMRNNDERLQTSHAVITVYRKDGTVAAESNPNTLSAGIFRFPLEPEEYTVRATGLPAGYTAEEAEVRPGNPYCSIPLTASLLTDEAPKDTRYQVGSVMHDFTVRDYDGTTYTLSALLAQKRAVVLNFWYDGCAPCRVEFRYLELSYRAYRDKAEVLAITEDPDDTDAAVRAYATQMELTFPMISVESRIGLESMFNVTSVPTTVVIDSEGVVTEIHTGSSTQQYFDSIFEKYTADTYIRRGNAAVPTALEGEWSLPAKRDEQ